jgi:hypothetical protein
MAKNDKREEIHALLSPTAISFWHETRSFLWNSVTLLNFYRRTAFIRGFGI